MRTIGNYFGNHWATGTAENKNRSFYLDRSSSDSEDIHLNELKGKQIGVCAEKAAVAQNLLSFLGYESYLVASSNCRLESPDKPDPGGHMFNIIKSGENQLIFDPTNSSLIMEDDGSVHTVMPAIYPLNTEEYQLIMNGGQVTVVHNDGIWDGNQTIKGPDQTRIYGGPTEVTAK